MVLYHKSLYKYCILGRSGYLPQPHVERSADANVLEISIFLW